MEKPPVEGIRSIPRKQVQIKKIPIDRFLFSVPKVPKKCKKMTKMVVLGEFQELEAHCTYSDIRINSCKVNLAARMAVVKYFTHKCVFFAVEVPEKCQKQQKND